MLDPQELVAWTAEQLADEADPDRAAAMAAYLKTDMAFYGVGRTPQKAILRAMIKRFPLDTAAEYETAVRTLWAQPHREEKYLAIDFAKRHRRFIVTERLPLYQQLIVEGAWWDFVDTVAGRLIGQVLLDDRATVSPVMREWVEDQDMWLRRTAILSQLFHREETDAEMLFEFCIARADEKEFFIRKAIGWSLRQYARVAPDAVRGFLLEHRSRLSGLSFREAAKHLGEVEG